MSTKQKILLVDKSFAYGGIQTSLINLVDALKDRYDIDVLMFYGEGELKSRFPAGVRLLQPSFFVRLHGMTLADAKRTKNPLVILFRYLFAISDKLFTNRLSVAFSLLFQPVLKGYDAAIAFHQEDSPKAIVSGFYRFVLKRTDAPVKLGWVHYDPRRVSYDDTANVKYMKQMDRIVCVSKGCSEVFAAAHPELAEKITYCYNFHDADRIRKLSEQSPAVPMDEQAFCCFSACRLTAEKALVRAINALANTFRRHRDIKWYIAGDGSEREAIASTILINGLEEQIVLLGSQENPFSYMRRADLYLQVSEHEAAPMVFAESLLCGLPVLATKTISAEECILPQYGLICENSATALATAFAGLMEDRGIVAEWKQNLKDYTASAETNVARFADLLKH